MHWVENFFLSGGFEDMAILYVIQLSYDGGGGSLCPSLFIYYLSKNLSPRPKPILSHIMGIFHEFIYRIYLLYYVNNGLIFKTTTQKKKINTVHNLTPFSIVFTNKNMWALSIITRSFKHDIISKVKMYKHCI